MNIRDRIKELRRVPASQLIPNPMNWRKHPQRQQDAIRGILAEVGYVDALLAREDETGIHLIDGHLRAETTPDMEVPVLILDVDEAEAKKILATFDPLSAMAETDPGALDELLRQVDTGSEALQVMLTDMAEKAGIIPLEEFDPTKEWVGMPEFENEEVSEIELKIYFPDETTKVQFSKQVGQQIDLETKFVWYPKESKPMRQNVDQMKVVEDA